MRALRRFASARLDRGLISRLPQLGDEDLRRPSVVVAPHPDDETLGCGGVACRMIARGTPVHFVIVTDGAASHPVIPGPELRAMREAEAVEAVARLGGRPDTVSFLGIPDGRASDLVEEIADGLLDLFRAMRPAQVFVPHPEDPLADHVAVHRGTRLALGRYGAPVTVLEYPVWYWFHWPWVPIFGHPTGLWKKALRQSVRTRLGTRALGTMNVRADIADVLDRKREALAAHVSQTRKPDDASSWTVLADLGAGGFLARLVSDQETFTRYTLPGAPDGAELHGGGARQERP